MTFTGPNAIPDPAPTTLSDLAPTVDPDLQPGGLLEPGRTFPQVGEPDASPAPKPVPAKHLATQTQYPWRTSVRTGVATLLLVLGAAAAVTADPTVGGFIGAHFPDLLPKVLAVGVFCGALATVLKRIGSIPAVARLFVRLGLGVVPKSALK